MKKLVILLIVTMVFVGLMVGSAGAEVIYLEKFQGDGSTGINGTTPTIGVGPWECKADFVQTDGLILGGGGNGAWAGASLLPFNPVAGGIYTMQVELYHTGNNPDQLKYIGIGFSSLGTEGTKQDTGYRFPQNGGICYYEYGQGGGIATSAKPGSAIENNGTYIGEEWVTLKTVIDATGDGSSITVEFFLNDESITVGGPQTIARSIEDINYCGIGSYGTRNGDSPVGSIVDNFIVYEGTLMVPDPADDEAISPANLLTLSWTNMDPNDPSDSVYVDVWFGTDPNIWTKIVDALVDGENTTEVDVDASAVDTYYWRVDSYLNGAGHINDPNKNEGYLWTFHTVADSVPTVVINTPAQITWSGGPVPLEATVTNDNTTPTTIVWSASPADNVVITGGDTATPTVTITRIPYNEAKIVNAGFEAVLTGEPPNDWGPEPATGWTNIIGSSGTWNPPANAYSKTYSSGTNVPEGQMCGWSGLNPGGTTTMSQVLAETLATDTQYELSVMVGNSMRYDWPGYNVQLLAGGTILVEDPNVNVVVPYDDWALVTVTYDSSSSTADPSLIGQPLEIRLGNLGMQGGADDNWAEVNYDDVKLTANPPFPAPTWGETITLTVAVSDEGNPDPVTDSVEIDVYGTACDAARIGLGKTMIEGQAVITDYNGDCITDLEDFAVLAAIWLGDYSPEGPIDRP